MENDNPYGAKDEGMTFAKLRALAARQHKQHRVQYRRSGVTWQQAEHLTAAWCVQFGNNPPITVYLN